MSLDTIGVRFASEVDPNFASNVAEEFARIQANAIKALSTVGVKGFGDLVSAARNKLAELQASPAFKNMPSILPLDAADLKKFSDVERKARDIARAFALIQLGGMKAGATDLNTALGGVISRFELAKIAVESSTVAASNLATAITEANIRTQLFGDSSEAAASKYKALESGFDKLVSEMAAAHPEMFFDKAGMGAAELMSKVEIAAKSVSYLKKDLATLKAEGVSQIYGATDDEGNPMSGDSKAFADNQAKIKATEQALAESKRNLQGMLSVLEQLKTEYLETFKATSEKELFKKKQTEAVTALRTELKNMKTEAQQSGNMLAYNVAVVQKIDAYYKQFGGNLGDLNARLASSKTALTSYIASNNLLAAAWTAMGGSAESFLSNVITKEQAAEQVNKKYGASLVELQQALQLIDADTIKYGSDTDRIMAKLHKYIDFFKTWGVDARTVGPEFDDLVASLSRLLGLSTQLGAKPVLASMGATQAEMRENVSLYKTYQADIAAAREALLELKTAEGDIYTQLSKTSSVLATVDELTEKYGEANVQLGDGVQFAVNKLATLLAYLQKMGSGTAAPQVMDAAKSALGMERFYATLTKTKEEMVRLEAEEYQHGNSLENLLAKVRLLNGVVRDWGTTNAWVATKYRETSLALMQMILAEETLIPLAERYRIATAAEGVAAEKFASSVMETVNALQILSAEYRIHGNAQMYADKQLTLLLQHITQYGLKSPEIRAELERLSREYQVLASSATLFSDAMKNSQATAPAAATQAYASSVRELAESMNRLNAEAAISGNKKQAQLDQIRLLEEWTARWGRGNVEVNNTLAKLRQEANPFFSNLVSSMKDLILLQMRWAFGWNAMMGAFNALRSGFTAIIQYEQQIKNLEQITQSNTAQTEIMSDAIRSTALVTRFSANEVAKAATTLGQAGFTAAETSVAIKEVAMLATATMASLSDAVDVTTTALRAFELDASQTVEVVNTLAAAANLSKLSVEGMKTVFNYVASSSDIVGYKLEEVSAAMAIMSNAGIRMSTIGTGLRNIMSSLLTPTAEMVGALYDIGITIDQVDPKTHSLSEILQTLREHSFDATTAFAAFGKRGGDAIAALVNNSAQFDNFLIQLVETGRVAGMASEQMKPVESQWIHFKNTLIDTALSLKDTIIPSLNVLLGAVNGLADVLRVVTSSLFGGNEQMAAMAVKASFVALQVGALVRVWQLFLKVRVRDMLVGIADRLMFMGEYLPLVTGGVNKLKSAMEIAFGGSVVRFLFNPWVMGLGAIAAAVYAVTTSISKHREALKTAGQTAIDESQKAASAELARLKKLKDVQAILERTATTEAERNEAIKKYLRLTGEYNSSVDENGKLIAAAAKHLGSFNSILAETIRLQEKQAGVKFAVTINEYASEYARAVKQIKIWRDELARSKGLAGTQQDVMGVAGHRQYTQKDQLYIQQQIEGWEKARVKVLAGAEDFARAIKQQGVDVRGFLSAYIVDAKDFYDEVGKAIDQTANEMAVAAGRKKLNAELLKSISSIEALKKLMKEGLNWDELLDDWRDFVEQFDEPLAGFLKSLSLSKAELANVGKEFKQKWTALIAEVQSETASPEALNFKIMDYLAWAYKEAASLAKDSSDARIATATRAASLEEQAKELSIAALKAQAEEAEVASQVRVDYINRIKVAEDELHDMQVQHAREERKLRLDYIAALKSVDEGFTGNLEKEIAEVEAAYDKRIAELDKEKVSRARATEKEIFSITMEVASQSFEMLADRQDAMLERLDFFYEQVESKLKASLERGEITEQAYQERSLALTTAKMQKEKEIYDRFASSTVALKEAIGDSVIPLNPEDLKLKNEFLKRAYEVEKKYYERLKGLVSEFANHEVEARKKVVAARQAQHDIFAALYRAEMALISQEEGGVAEGATMAIKLVERLLSGSNVEGKPQESQLLTKLKDLNARVAAGTITQREFDAALSEVLVDAQALNQVYADGSSDAQRYNTAINTFGDSFRDWINSLDTVPGAFKDLLGKVRFFTPELINLSMILLRAFDMRKVGASVDEIKPVIVEGLDAITASMGRLGGKPSEATDNMKAALTAARGLLTGLLAEYEAKAQDAEQVATRAKDAATGRLGEVASNLGNIVSEQSRINSVGFNPNVNTTPITEMTDKAGQLVSSLDQELPIAADIAVKGLEPLKAMVDSITFQPLIDSAINGVTQVGKTVAEFKSTLNEAVVTKIVVDLKSMLMDVTGALRDSFNGEAIVRAINDMDNNLGPLLADIPKRTAYELSFVIEKAVKGR